MPKIPALALGSAIVALGLGACGGSNSSSSAPSSSASATSAPATTSTPSGGAASSGLSVAADPGGQLKFSSSSLSTKAGTVTITFTNASSVGHNLTIQQGTSGPDLGATPTFTGGSKTLTVKLKPGTYTFFCSVPGHRAAGMLGTLTVS